MLVSINSGTPIYTPQNARPYYRTLQKGTSGSLHESGMSTTEDPSHGVIVTIRDHGVILGPIPIP